MPDPNQLPSHRRIRRLNLRQRKKLCVGEFQEFGFPLHITFRAGLDDAGYSAFLDEFFDLVESRSLITAFGGSAPADADAPQQHEGFVCRDVRGSASEDDRTALLTWLQARHEVVEARAGELVDAWYGWEG